MGGNGVMLSYTNKEVDNIFKYASNEILHGYMFMGHSKYGNLMFKHKLTRQYIEIPQQNKEIE